MKAKKKSDAKLVLKGDKGTTAADLQLVYNVRRGRIIQVEAFHGIVINRIAFSKQEARQVIDFFIKALKDLR
ncbi:MAG: hypothetical protein AAB575_00210 [Patescibacteria group bacterium]